MPKAIRGMVEVYLRHGPLDHLGLAARQVATPGAARVHLAVRRGIGKVNLRGQTADPLFRAAVKDATGTEPPAKANRVAVAGHRQVIWLGPDEWLVTAPAAEESTLAANLRARLMGQHAAVTMVGEARAVIALAGGAAREVMAKLCPLDLHSRAFSVGDCAQSLVARVQALVHQRSEAPLYDLYVDRSYASWLWQRLEDAGLEFGVAILAEPLD